MNGVKWLASKRDEDRQRDDLDGDQHHVDRGALLGAQG